jgi:hypothetical protein
MSHTTSRWRGFLFVFGFPNAVVFFRKAGALEM